MTQSPVDICNLALGNLGVGRIIQSIDERTLEARECKRFYESARAATLRAFDWSFARQYGPLVLRADIVPMRPFNLVYQLPTNCAAFRRIENDRGGSEARVPFEITLNETSTSSVIHTNKIGAVGRWTVDLNQPELYDAGFVVALSWQLSTSLAMPITRSQDKQKNAYAMFKNLISEAMAQSANEEPRDFYLEDTAAEWHRARK